MIQRTSTALTDQGGALVGFADGWSGFTSEEQKLRHQEFRRNGGVDLEEFYGQEADRESSKP